MATVRPERPGDLAAIHAVHAASFPTDAEAGWSTGSATGGRGRLVGACGDPRAVRLVPAALGLIRLAGYAG